ncbi:MAG TPA: TonB family protein [Thermoanaerobaculia bacterium]|jgi:TonB family protein|nr:TonB family protein [Thermoanaerobaculia bacterium]
MFETSVVQVREVAAERRFGLLSASIAAHSFIVVALIASSLSAINFPAHAPNQMELFRAVELPPVPIQKGRPDGGQQKQPEQKPAVATPQKPTDVTAPRTTPDRVTALQPPSAASTDTNPGTPSAGSGDGTGTNTGPVGDPNGIQGGLPIVPEAVIPPPAPTQIFRAVGEVKPATVLYRVSPSYPAMAARAGISGVVVVECIIGSDGTIRDPHVVRSSFAAFNQPAMDAVSQWRFAPGTLHGSAVDTYFELTVTFTLHR